MMIRLIDNLMHEGHKKEHESSILRILRGGETDFRV